MLNSKPLIRFDGTKLILVENELPSTPVKILSIIGKARMGKSSFLNAFISKYTGKNTTVFTTQDGDDHCTLGIDYYYIPEENLLLLDSQGLAHENASHDPSLLLFIYLVSNIVIFNESTMLQNSALKLIEPICTFTQYLDMDTCEKPALIFRISDAKRGSDIHKTLEKLMAHHNDQYNSIRESVENVFAQPVKIIKTEYPQTTEDSLLSSNDYMGLLSVKENGFDTAIRSIIDDISVAVPRESLLRSVPAFIDNINNNEQININKLDIVALTHNNDILTWLNKVPAELKSEIEVDGTQDMYEKNVVTRQAAVKALKTDFTKRFKNITETIKKEHKTKLDAEIDGPIERAKISSDAKAREFLQKNGLESLMAPKCIGAIADAGITDSASNPQLLTGYLGSYQSFQKAIQHLYEPIRMMYDKIINSMYEEVNKNLERAREVSRVQRELVEYKCKVTLETFDAWLLDEINGRDSSIIFEKNSDIYSGYRKQKIDEVMEFIVANVKKKDVLINIVTGNKMEATLIDSFTGEVNTKYELIADIYLEFVRQINLYPLKESGVDDFLIDKKEGILKGTLLLDPIMAKKIYLINPEIKFVYDPILLKTFILDTQGLAKTEMPFMTLHTWVSVYEPFYKRAMDNLIADAVCQRNTFRDFVNEIPDEGNIIKIGTHPSTMYEMNVCELLIQEMKKVFCRMSVIEFEFPKEFVYELSAKVEVMPLVEVNIDSIIVTPQSPQAPQPVQPVQPVQPAQPPQPVQPPKAPQPAQAPVTQQVVSRKKLVNYHQYNYKGTVARA
jgi:hypothetical protein